MGDCPGCWNAVCSCGQSWSGDYSSWSPEEIDKLVAWLLQMKTERIKYGNGPDWQMKKLKSLEMKGKTNE